MGPLPKCVGTGVAAAPRGAAQTDGGLANNGPVVFGDGPADPLGYYSDTFFRRKRQDQEKL
jgi:hypothetical protein